MKRISEGVRMTYYIRAESLLGDVGRVQGHGVHLIGCSGNGHNATTGYFNKSYVKAEKNIARLKLN